MALSWGAEGKEGKEWDKCSDFPYQLQNSCKTNKVLLGPGLKDFFEQLPNYAEFHFFWAWKGLFSVAVLTETTNCGFYFDDELWVLFLVSDENNEFTVFFFWYYLNWQSYFRVFSFTKATEETELLSKW